MQPRFFARPADFRRWLGRNAVTTSELVVGFHKVGSGHPSMSWPESVDEALCFGWIDGVRKRIDDQSYLIRFTPRKAGSIWSAVNVAKAENLIVQGRMQPAGLAAYQRRTEARTRVYAYEQVDEAQLTTEEQRAFRRDKAAWKYFESAPAGYRRTVLHWINAARRPETRVRRLGQLMAACAEGKRL
jgi:uncharacterized protein YdeI (YjbR/CyaY-like superfamily)